MRLLIAEAKTMTGCDTIVPADVLAAHRPMMDSTATSLMETWSHLQPEEISRALKVSPALAAHFLRLAYEFPNKALGQRAIEAFTGVVFKAFDFQSLPAEAQTRAFSRVNIISSAYGLLRADDIVKAYRLDYSARVAPEGMAMARFWQPLITPALIESLRRDGDEVVIDLLPADAAKCLDWNAIRKTARVVRIDFRALADGGSLKTPHSTLLKTLRGRLLREIILRDIDSVESLAALDTPTLSAAPDSDPAADTLTFLASER